MTMHAHAFETPSRPEKIGLWMFKTTASWRTVLAFALVVALTYISVRFNFELGKLSSVDPVSHELLPTGYALLDMCALFLSGYVGLRSRSPIRKAVAWVWFVFLLCLSLWSAAAFTLSVDYRQSAQPLDHQIEQKRHELTRQQATVELWQDNVKNTVKYKTRHQKTLANEEAKAQRLAAELSALEEERLPAAHIIYQRAAPFFGVTPELLQLIIRLAWSSALTLSPLILMLLLAIEFEVIKKSPSPHPEGGKKKRFTTTDQTEPMALPVEHPAGAMASKVSLGKPSPIPAATADNLTRSSEATLPDRVKQATTGLPDRVNQPTTSLPDQVSLEKTKPTTALPDRVRSKPKSKPRRANRSQRLLSAGKGGATRKTAHLSSPDRHDTGTQLSKGNRYSRIKQAVSTGKVKPSIPAIKLAGKCGQTVAVKYLTRMEEEGVIRRDGRGYYEVVTANPLRLVQ